MPLHAFIDVETTGLSPSTDAVTEIAVLLRRGHETLAELSVLVDPGRSIPPEISSMTGITDDMVVGSPCIGEVLPAVRAIVRNAVVVGHNVSFDLEFLSKALTEAGLPSLENESVDTVDLARQLLGDEVPDHRLSTVARHLRSDGGSAHRALGDARMTAEVFRVLSSMAAVPEGEVAAAGAVRLAGDAA